MINKCANCGKKFFVAGGMWGYAYGSRLTCSYHCMRDMRREDLEMGEDKKKYCYWSDHDKSTAISMKREGKNNAEIAEALGRTEHSVQKWLWYHSSTISRKAETIIQEAKTMAEEAKKTEITTEPAQESAPAPIDKARIIRTLCDAVELLKRLCEEV